MRRIGAIFGSIIFFFIAPFTIAGIVPWWITRWQVQAPEYALPFAQAIGLALVALGTIFLIDSFARFALKGLGTPAPIFPPKHLVVDGLYRYVRNPMYVGVVAATLGQAMIFASAGLLIYGALIWLAFNIFVVIYEEPTLRETFGAEYDEFCKHVHRWLPRLTPWRGGGVEAAS
jgi:protein-S-isoprenylcysteine O-methyltransferase Ste14